MHLSKFPDGPSGCCLITGRAEDPDGFINTELPADPRKARGAAIVSATIVRELAQEIGMVSAADYSDVLAEVDKLRADLEEVNDELKVAHEEAAALMVLIGPKLWGKAQHIRKNAGFYGRQRIKAIQDFGKDEIDEEQLEEAFCSTPS